MPIKSGGLGIPILADSEDQEFSTSVQITAPLAALMVLQKSNLPDPVEVIKTRSEVRNLKQNMEKQKEEIILSTVCEKTRKAVDQTKEKGASS